MSALRLARGFTGRSKVVKFAGLYHGHVDALLASAGSGLATFALPDSAGVPASSAGETIVLPFNDVARPRGRLRRARRRDRRGDHRGVPGQHGRGPSAARLHRGPAPDHPGPRRPAISDEVMTGFRCSASGWYGLEGPYDEGPADLFTFGKVMGGGFPAAAFGGRADVMAHARAVRPGLPGGHAVG